ncbi:MAG: hypothetical protein MUO43_00235 [Desulfobacterales bacterium]|nr:hypothetical protein [Desulfobacterales bacterium]
MESKQKFKPDPKLKLMEQVRQVLRYHHYAYRTERSYCNWIVQGELFKYFPFYNKFRRSDFELACLEHKLLCPLES